MRGDLRTCSAHEAEDNLELVLSLMANHPAAPNPRTYTVWYTYVSRKSPDLTAAINSILNGNGKLTDTLVQELYDRFIATPPRQQDATTDTEARVQRLLHDVARTAEISNYKIESFERSLALHTLHLTQELTASGMQAVVEDMGNESRRMRDAISQLGRDLKASTEEIKHLQEALRRAREDAVTDTLTGLANRKGFNEELTRLIGTGYNPDITLCLLMIDIDHFKRINDQHGHLFGDKVLRLVGQVLRASLRDDDIVARYGGEEFSVLLPDTDLAAALEVAEQLRSAVAEARIQRRRSAEVIECITVSIGLTTYRSGESCYDFIGRADAALYLSKTAGRDRVTVDAGEIVGTKSGHWGGNYPFLR